MIACNLAKRRAGGRKGEGGTEGGLNKRCLRLVSPGGRGGAGAVDERTGEERATTII